MSRHWGSGEDIDAHVFEEYGRAMFEVQLFEFALERLVAQGPARPAEISADAAVAWGDDTRRMRPGRKLQLADLDDDVTGEVTAILERRDVFAHELLLAGCSTRPHFDPALARELTADTRSLAADAHELRQRLERDYRPKRIREGKRPS